jgi:hypothetical protein
MRKILFALVALIGIVACESKEPTREYELNLLVDKSGIVADGNDAVTFQVYNWEGELVEGATIHFADTHEALEGMQFRTKYAGEYSFYAKHGSKKSEVWTIIAIEAGEEPGPGPEPQPQELKLSVEPATIYVNQTVTFKVELDGNNVTSEATIYLAEGDVALNGATYTPTAEGKYAFYAKFEEQTSNSVEIEVLAEIVQEQKPITIQASKSTIKANGVEYADLTVTEEGGADVTSSSTIYVNGGKLNGSKFATTTAGTYTIYATKGDKTSNEITIVAEQVTSTDTSTIFAEGVTLTSGWYDVNKKSTPQNAQADAMMCWAASSSNIIQWFQDRYVDAGNTLPAGCPNGTSSSYGYELQIMDVFRDNWENLARGNWTDGGVIWYFEGRDLYSTNGTENRAYPRSGTGGYFKSQWSTIFADMYQYEDLNWGWLYNPTTYITEINNYNWRGSSVADPLLKFSEYIINAFEHGMSSMAVAMSSNFNGAHAVTIWGYEVDNATGYVTKLYIADSDDGSTPVLQPYAVRSESGNSKIALTGYTTYYPFALYPVSGYGSAK